MLRPIAGIGRAASCRPEWQLLWYASGCVLSRFDYATDDDCAGVSTMLPFMYG